MDIRKITAFVHGILKNKISAGDAVVDATMGNGHDTCFLATLVGNAGRVYSFDIQDRAIEQTRELLRKNRRSLQNIYLILDGHENIGNHVNVSIAGAMFNLGYLPGGNKKIITRFDTTEKALSTIFTLLRPGGIVSIVIYYGHEGGEEEKDRLIKYVDKLDSQRFTVLRCNYSNHMNNPPIIIFIQKNN